MSSTDSEDEEVLYKDEKRDNVRDMNSPSSKGRSRGYDSDFRDN